MSLEKSLCDLMLAEAWTHYAGCAQGHLHRPSDSGECSSRFNMKFKAMPRGSNDASRSVVNLGQW